MLRSPYEDERLARVEADSAADSGGMRAELLHDEADAGALEKQLDALGHGSLYSFYVLSARLRYAFFFVLVLAILLALMLAFMLAILFSVLLPSARDDHGWGVRASYMLPLAPFVLLLGSWMISSLAELVADAARPTALLRFRQRLVAVAHATWHRPDITTGDRAAKRGDLETEAKRYRGPPLGRGSLLLTDIVAPVALEVVPLSGALKGFLVTRSASGAVSAYLAFGLLLAASAALLYGVLNVLCTKVRLFRVVCAWVETSAPRLGRGWLVPPGAAVGLHPSNLGRHLRTERYWARREERRAAAALREHEKRYGPADGGDRVSPAGSIVIDADAGVVEHAAESYRRCTVRVPWAARFVAVVALYVAAALITAYGVVSFAVGYFFVSFLIFMLGLTLREKLETLGRVFVCSLFFFCLLSVILLALASANVEPSSDIIQTGGDAEPVVSTDLVEPTYLVCGRAWGGGGSGGGLDVVDLAILSDLAYASDEASFASQMAGAFNETALADYEVIARNAEPDDVIHWRATDFDAANITVVSVRGTSTAPEAYEDLYLFGAIGMFDLADSVLPLTRALPDNLLERMLAAIALPGFAAAPSWHGLLSGVERLQREGKTLLLTGHSLGGALAGAVGARLGVTAVTFSAPGLFYNQRRFGFGEGNLEVFTTNVVPNNDLVPRVDRQGGAVVRIGCSFSAPRCHSIHTTLCTLHKVCGDSRNREWHDYCEDDA